MAVELPRGFHCAHCGHQHAAMPEDHVCQACGDAKVVDVRDPRHEEMLAILQARSRRPRFADVKLAAASVLLLAVAFLLAIKLYFEPRDAARKAEVAKLAGVRFIGDALRVEDDAALRAYHATIAAGAQQLAPCAGELEAARVGRLLTLRWRIDVDGGVADISAREEVATDVLACAASVVEAWQFAPPPRGESLGVEVPITFVAFRGETRAICPETSAVFTSDDTLRPSPESM